MHVDRARVAGEGVAPDALEQLVAREDEAPVVEQLPEEVELLRRQLDLLLTDADFAGKFSVDASSFCEANWQRMPLIPTRYSISSPVAG